jgi:DNA mismatch repair ATPase MutS
VKFSIFFIVIAILGLLFLFNLWEERQKEKKARNWLRRIYGVKPDYVEGSIEKIEDDIARYYSLVKDDISNDEIVDDITWNDLEMNRIFCRLNTTQSFIGEQVLFSELHRLSKDKKDLERREKVIEFYDTNGKERENTQLCLLKLKKEKINYFLPMFIDIIEMQKIPFVWSCRILLLTLSILVLAVVFTLNKLVIVAACINFLVNIFVYAIAKSKYEVYMDSLSGIIHTVKTSKHLVSVNEANNIETKISMKENIRKLDKLSRMIGALERKKQASITGDLTAIVMDYFIGALMWDFIVYDRVIRNLMGNQKEFMELYQFVGEIDMCISIASFRKSLVEYCIPEFSEKKLVMDDIYHPLIEMPVKNSLDMRKSILLTGSNASGKSTFVKAIAINIILGQSIHTCAAKHMMIPNAKIITSMAIRDDILSGESYYIREIKYLKRMIEKSNEERMLICGIDEILRGTNTMERVAASMAILNYLYDKNCLIMVATHDLELAKILEEKYDNYYFCETFEDNDVVFNYELHKGISNTHNAIQLLQSVGFPEEIVESARKNVVYN